MVVCVYTNGLAQNERMQHCWPLKIVMTLTDIHVGMQSDPSADISVSMVAHVF